MGLACSGGSADLFKTVHRFFFPRFLSLLRRLEPFLAFSPLGSQYMLFLGLDEQDEGSLQETVKKPVQANTMHHIQTVFCLDKGGDLMVKIVDLGRYPS